MLWSYRGSYLCAFLRETVKRVCTNQFFFTLGGTWVPGKHARGTCPRLPQTAEKSIVMSWIDIRSSCRARPPIVFGHCIEANGAATQEAVKSPPPCAYPAKYIYIYNSWPWFAPTLKNIVCILGLASVGNDAVNHANGVFAIIYLYKITFLPLKKPTAFPPRFMGVCARGGKNPAGDASEIEEGCGCVRQRGKPSEDAKTKKEYEVRTSSNGSRATIRKQIIRVPSLLSDDRKQQKHS